MRISAISNGNTARSYSNRVSKTNQRMNKGSSISNVQADNIAFEARAGRILGKTLGLATGAAAGGAIIGGGSLATGVAMLTGPVGIAVVAGLYFVGGALAGGYIGDGIGDVVEDRINEKDKDKDD